MPCQCSRPAPSAQSVEAPAPRPRSGIAGLPAHGLWPELTVATGSSRSSVVHTAPGYLCPCRHSQAVKPLWFGRTLTQYLVTENLHWQGCRRISENLRESRSSETARSEVRELESVAGQACAGPQVLHTHARTHARTHLPCAGKPVQDRPLRARVPRAACRVPRCACALRAAGMQRSVGSALSRGQQSAPTMSSPVARAGKFVQRLGNSSSGGKPSQAPRSDGSVTSVPAWGLSPAMVLHNPSQIQKLLLGRAIKQDRAAFWACSEGPQQSRAASRHASLAAQGKKGGCLPGQGELGRR